MAGSVFVHGASVVVVAGMLLLGGCGGGGGSGGGLGGAPVNNNPPATGFDAGQFQPSSQFENLCANPRGGNFPDRQGTATDENNWLRSWSNELYLWYDEITDQNPKNYTTPAYFDLMKTTAITGSGAPKDRFHFTYPSDVWEQLSQSGIQAGYGAEFVIVAGTPPREVVVAFVSAGTPAAQAGLVRGTRLVSIDGVAVVDGDDVDTLNNGLFPEAAGETHNFVIQNPGAAQTTTVSMTSAEVELDPVQFVQVIDVGGGPVGYLHFNAHIATAEEQLVSAFQFLEGQNVVDLVLDLRYNGGGYLDIANETAYMIAGNAGVGRVFDQMRFNDKNLNTNPVTGGALDPTLFHQTTQGFSGPAGVALPALNLPRVFVLTTSGTCSASEAIINGLRGVGVEVIQIGGTTCGKPYGFYPWDNCGTTYFSIQFQGANAQGFSDYPDGFGQSAGAVALPGCEGSDDYDHQLGDPDENLLAAALEYQNTGSCPVGFAATATATAAQRGIAASKPGDAGGRELTGRPGLGSILVH
ncbi:MAG: PDZ domain-containing protein [Pseudomonadales bacterium]|nr:PDZ domain-containing protein [Pseudomonadales bacterium]MCP5186067.1 PDZ domain-containing protein [Pseudomonadales bacterium]